MSITLHIATLPNYAFKIGDISIDERIVDSLVDSLVDRDTFHS
jgi:hypothetical protein